jgi:small subunit ribosomal protein S1
MEENQALPGAEEAKPETQPNGESSALPSMEDLLEQTDIELEIPQPGEIRTGTIVRVNPDEILVSIGAKSEGVILGRELERLSEEERNQELVEGKEIPVYVIKTEDQNGNVLLSYVRAREETDWEWVEGLLNSGENIDAKIAGYNKGGLIVPMGTLRGFIPASQVSATRRVGAEGGDQRWAKMVGEPIKVRVIEVDKGRRRLILSERAALQETREALKERLLDELNEGDIRTGRVTSLADFGAFVNIDGADGLVHLSEISWDHIGHPSEVLKVGQQVDVKVISVDRDRRRIGLSLRQLQEDPWVSKAKEIKVGQLVEGVITHLTKFGAFAKIAEDDDLEGLIHISELSEARIGHPKEVVHEDDKLTLRVIKIDIDRRRIGLSLRKVDSAAYADLDWKIALAEEVDEIDEADQEDEAGVVSEETSEESTSVADDLPEAGTDNEAETAAETGVVEAEIDEDVEINEDVEAAAEAAIEPEEVVVETDDDVGDAPDMEAEDDKIAADDVGADAEAVEDVEKPEE